MAVHPFFPREWRRSVSSAARNGNEDNRHVNGGKELLPSPGAAVEASSALLALVHNGMALFSAWANAGAAAKTLTAPLDRVKLLMQTHAVRFGEGGVKKGIGFLEAGFYSHKEGGMYQGLLKRESSTGFYSHKEGGMYQGLLKRESSTGYTHNSV